MNKTMTINQRIKEVLRLLNEVEGHLSIIAKQVSCPVKKQAASKFKNIFRSFRSSISGQKGKKGG